MSCMSCLGSYLSLPPGLCLRVSLQQQVVIVSTVRAKLVGNVQFTSFIYVKDMNGLTSDLHITSLEQSKGYPQST